MATLTHLCRKDFAFAKHALFGAWAVFLATALMPLFITGALVEAAAPILGLLLAVQYFQIFAATLKILRTDSYSGGDAFIGTRPVTGSTLWLSKVLSITAFVLVPWLLMKALAVIALRLQLAPSDWLLFFVETTLAFGIPATIAWIVGTHTRHFAWATLLTIGLAGGALWLAVTIFRYPGGFWFLEEGMRLKTSRWLLAETMILAAGPLLAWSFLARKRLGPCIAAGVATFVIIAVMSTRSQLNFVSRIALSNVEEAPAADQLRITWLGEPCFSSSTRNGERFTVVVRGGRIDGAPDDWLANPVGVTSRAVFRDGATIAGKSTYSPNYGVALRALLPSLGIPQPEDDPATSEMRYVQGWFEASSAELGKLSETTADIVGEARVELNQPVILADLPACAGESVPSGRFRYRIDRIEPSPDGRISVDVSATGISLFTRGDMRSPHDEIEILIVNPRTGRHTQLGSSSGSTSATFGWWSQRREMSIETSSPGERIDPAAFLNGARFYVVGRSYRGTVEVPFEIPEIRLEEER